MRKLTALNHLLSPAARILVLAAVLGSLLLVFSASEVKAKDGYAVIDCYCEVNNAFSSIGEPKRDHNEVYVGETMTWFLIGPEGTTVKIEFSSEGNCSGINPFETQPSLEGTIKNANHMFDKIKSPKIASGMGGEGKCYSYKFTCSNYPTVTQPAPADPIIDVPH